MRWLPCAALAVVACVDPVPRGSVGATETPPPPRAARRAPLTTADDPAEVLVGLHHEQWVRGEIGVAERGLRGLLSAQSTPYELRARVALRLAEIAEARGARRAALDFLEDTKRLAGEGEPLALEADAARARILSAAPLADVRGPTPGTVLRGEVAAAAAAFRRAEKLLLAYHRVTVAPRLENIDTVLLAKRRALAAAAQAYQRAIELGGGTARAAANFRVAAMYHHLAEALVFERPKGLLPAVAQRLTRVLRQESTTYLRRALSRYRAAIIAPPIPTSAVVWREAARREAAQLQHVVGGRRLGASD